MSEKTYPNAGPAARLDYYRTGQYPMVGDRVRGHDQPVEKVGRPSILYKQFIGSESVVTDLLDGGVVVVLQDDIHESAYAARFDLISRAVPSPAESPASGGGEEELNTLREALWTCMEHNRLHHGPNHNTVIQAEEALSGWTPKPPEPVLLIAETHRGHGWVHGWTTYTGQKECGFINEGKSVLKDRVWLMDPDARLAGWLSENLKVHRDGPIVVHESDWTRVLELVAAVNAA